MKKLGLGIITMLCLVATSFTSCLDSDNNNNSVTPNSTAVQGTYSGRMTVNCNGMAYVRDVDVVIGTYALRIDSISSTDILENAISDSALLAAAKNQIGGNIPLLLRCSSTATSGIIPISLDDEIGGIKFSSSTGYHYYVYSYFTGDSTSTSTYNTSTKELNLHFKVSQLLFNTDAVSNFKGIYYDIVATKNE